MAHSLEIYHIIGFTQIGEGETADLNEESIWELALRRFAVRVSLESLAHQRPHPLLPGLCASASGGAACRGGGAGRGREDKGRTKVGCVIGAVR